MKNNQKNQASLHFEAVNSYQKIQPILYDFQLLARASKNNLR